MKLREHRANAFGKTFKPTFSGTQRIIFAVVTWLVFAWHVPVQSTDNNPTPVDSSSVENRHYETRPHKSDNSPNLLPNNKIGSAKYWQLGPGATYDTKTSKSDDSSGSIRLTRPMPGGSVVRSGLIPVNPGKQYTFSFYLKTRNGPTYAGAQVSIHTQKGRFIRNLRSTRGTTTNDNEWQELVWPVLIPADAMFVRVEAFKMENTAPSGTVWVDEPFFGEGLVFREAPAIKHGFDGEQVRVDALGNFEVLRNDIWVPYFPLAIHSSNHRDWSVYSRLGWNTVIWTSSADEVEKARSAVSEFNPNGMMAGIMLAQYTQPKARLYNQLNVLESHINSIYSRNLQDQVLFYYWDNENHHSQWNVVNKVVSTIRQVEINLAGAKQHPLYALQGSVNVARLHAAHNLVDVSGTYYNYLQAVDDKASAVEQVTATPIKLLDRVQGQSSPAAIAQLNKVSGAGDFRLRTYNAITAGAKGIGYWRDCIHTDCQAEFPDVGPVDAKLWSPDIPLLRQEIDQLLPVIRQPHWTTWQPVTSNRQVHVGTRDYNDHKVLILVNQSAAEQQVELTLPRATQTKLKFIDFFTKQTEKHVRGNKLTLTLEGIGVGRGTRVILVK